MEAATSVPINAVHLGAAVTDKRLYRNNTAGHLGVVVLDHDGKPTGENVEPYGTVWLSDTEAILTARAPRRPEDNPFEEQVFVGVNPETQAKEEFVMRPLTLESTDQRYVPTERYVPTQDLPEGSGPETRQTSAAINEAPAPPPPSPHARPGSQALTAAPGPPQRTVADELRRTAPSRAPEPQSAPDEPEARQGWVQPPEAPGRVLTGALSGTDDGGAPEAAAAPEATNAPTERYVPVPASHQAVAPTPGATSGAEEHAARVDPQVGEETGAARPPSHPQPEGEYASREEVGSPEAPQQDETQIGG